MSVECPLTELPPEQCACRNHRGGHPPGEEPTETSAPFTAAYDGFCGRCGGDIRPGDQIVWLTEWGGYAHAEPGACR